MPNTQNNEQTSNSSSTAWQIIGRMIGAAIVLAVTAFFTPGFTINSIWTLVVATIVLTIMDYIIVKLTGINASPFGKGFVGFVLAAITLYLTQYFVVGYSISWMAAIIGALIYGIIDYIIPGEQQL